MAGWRFGLVWLLSLMVGGQAAVAAPPAAEASAAAAAPNAVTLVNRRIVELRAVLGGDSAAQRAEMARQALRDAVRREGPGVVTTTPAGPALRFEVDGSPVFYLVAEDLADGGLGGHGGLLEAAGQKVATRLTDALRAAREMRDPRAQAVAAAHALAATLALAVAAWGLLRVRRRGLAWLGAWAARWQAPGDGPGPAHGATGSAAAGPRSGPGVLLGRHVWQVLQAAVAVLTLVLSLVLLDLWASYVLQRFAYTRPWGEALTQWLLDLLARFALGTAAALPGLATALLIFALARLVTRASSAVLGQVERGELHLGWLDVDTAGPTRRVGNLLVWLFALAMAYPHLPGADSESFKGVSVLAGLMLSLGASGVVGQAVSGLTLMYARALRVGEYVKIGDTEGTVTAVGLFTTRVHTGMGEEVSLPNAHVMGLPVRNFSRLVPDGRFVLHTAVTIGYATPWRQVQAMLLEAARRTAGVAQQPAPYVIQTALSDFYVEYRLCCQGSRAAPDRRAEAMNQLHGHIQDVFNENGVQIMSPHYRSDPPEPQVVAPGSWFRPESGPLPPR